MDSSGDQGTGGGIANLNFAVSTSGAASGGFLTAFTPARNPAVLPGIPGRSCMATIPGVGAWLQHHGLLD